jgi:hypothetical protein
MPKASLARVDNFKAFRAKIFGAYLFKLISAFMAISPFFSREMLILCAKIVVN